jgi:hypothetical protein
VGQSKVINKKIEFNAMNGSTQLNTMKADEMLAVAGTFPDTKIQPVPHHRRDEN